MNKSIRERADRCGKASLTGPHDGVSDRVGERLATFPVWSAVQVEGHSYLLDSGTSECMLPSIRTARSWQGGRNRKDHDQLGASRSRADRSASAGRLLPEPYRLHPHGDTQPAQ